jgi:ABC-2 type transport system permease protein
MNANEPHQPANGDVPSLTSGLESRTSNRAQAAQPPFATSALRVFDLSLAQMLWSRRSVFLGVLVAGPMLLALVYRLATGMFSESRFQVNGSVVGGPVVFGMMMWLLYIRFIVPVLGVFYGTALIADEVDDKTLTYLFTRPIPRGAVLVGKYVAYLACTVLLVLPSVVVVYFLVVPVSGTIGGSFPALLADLGSLAAGLIAYGALFAFVGARLKRPLVTGLVFAFGWEPAVLLFPGYLKYLTVAYYVQAFVPQSMPSDSAVSALLQLFHNVPSVSTSILALTVISAGALVAAVNSVESREFVLEQ